MRETDVIQTVADRLERYPGQVNGVFDSDAELIRIGQDLWAITIDDFSAAEDRFQTRSWADLGWNLAVATLSDLLAVGADPAFFLQALSLPRDHEPQVLAGLAAGLQEALTAADAFMIGGDFGSAPSWRFCGTALGRIDGRHMMRQLPPEEQDLWVTGELGDIAVTTLLARDMPRLELRLTESRLIRQAATACIDTSGGFFQAVWDLRRVSPACRMTIEQESLPLAAETYAALPARNLPPEAALLGGAGEYELLFTVPADCPASFLDQLEQNNCTRIGHLCPAEQDQILIRHPNGKTTEMQQPPPDPRAVSEVAVHIRQVADLAGRLFP